MKLSLRQPDLEHESMVMENRILTTPKVVSTQIAGSALRSLATLAIRQKQKGEIALPQRALMAANNMYGEGKPLPFAIFGVHDKDKASVMTIYSDRSALLWRVTDDEFHPHPAVFTLKSRVQPFGHQKGGLSLVQTSPHKLDLLFDISKRRSHSLSSGDISKLPISASTVYVQLAMEVLAWTRALPKTPLAINQEGFTPGALPYSLFDEETHKDALKTHLEHAKNLIVEKLGDKMLAWAGSIQTRSLLQTGRLSEPTIDIQAIGLNRQRDKALEKRITRAFIAALKHPSCPVPFDSLVNQIPVWASKKGKVDKTYTHLYPSLLWSGHYKEISRASGHHMLQAYAHFGGPAVLFPK